MRQEHPNERPSEESFRPTEYIAPILAILLVLSLGAWVFGGRIWKALTISPAPQVKDERTIRRSPGVKSLPPDPHKPSQQGF